MGYWDRKDAKQKAVQQMNMVDSDVTEEVQEEVLEPDSGDDYVPTMEEMEADCAKEVSDWQQSFRERMKREQKRQSDVTDSEYYVCVYFSNRAQCDEFLETFGYQTTEKFVDGRKLARMCKRALQSPDTQFPRTQGISKDWAKRVKH